LADIVFKILNIRRFRMRKLISITLVQLILTIPPASMVIAQEAPEEPRKQEATFAQGVQEGKLSASTNYSAGGWAAGGFLGGLSLGLIGTGLVVGLTRIGSKYPPADEMIRIQDQTGPYRVGFMQGYNTRVKAKALGPSIFGGIAGTAVAVVIILSLQSDE
jgi:hypothetical protein